MCQIIIFTVCQNIFYNMLNTKTFSSNLALVTTGNPPKKHSNGVQPFTTRVRIPANILRMSIKHVISFGVCCMLTKHNIMYLNIFMLYQGASEAELVDKKTKYDNLTAQLLSAEKMLQDKETDLRKLQEVKKGLESELETDNNPWSGFYDQFLAPRGPAAARNSPHHPPPDSDINRQVSGGRCPKYVIEEASDPTGSKLAEMQRRHGCRSATLPRTDNNPWSGFYDQFLAPRGPAVARNSPHHPPPDSDMNRQVSGGRCPKYVIEEASDPTGSKLAEMQRRHGCRSTTLPRTDNNPWSGFYDQFLAPRGPAVARKSRNSPHHPPPGSDMNRQVSGGRCPKCDLMFPDLDTLQTHVVGCLESESTGSVGGKICPKCQESFPDLDTLQIHVMECLDN